MEIKTSERVLLHSNHYKARTNANSDAKNDTGGPSPCLTEMVKSTWLYRKRRRFRAGIEADISILERCFGLDRCTWKGLRSFKAYTWASIVSHHLLLLARHRLA